MIPVTYYKVLMHRFNYHYIIYIYHGYFATIYIYIYSLCQNTRIANGVWFFRPMGHRTNDKTIGLQYRLTNNEVLTDSANTMTIVVMHKAYVNAFLDP